MLYTGDNYIDSSQDFFFDVYYLVSLEYGCGQTKKALNNSKLTVNWDIRLVIR